MSDPIPMVFNPKDINKKEYDRIAKSMETELHPACNAIRKICGKETEKFPAEYATALEANLVALLRSLAGNQAHVLCLSLGYKAYTISTAKVAMTPEQIKESAKKPTYFG